VLGGFGMMSELGDLLICSEFVVEPKKKLLLMFPPDTFHKSTQHPRFSFVRASFDFIIHVFIYNFIIR
jgi:hypothetical protein